MEEKHRLMGALEAPISRPMGVALAVLFLAVLFYSSARVEALAKSDQFFDMRVFHAVGKGVTEGRSPFAAHDRYYYAPFVAWIFAPLAGLSLLDAARAWVFVSGGVWLLLVWQSLRIRPLAGRMAMVPALLSLMFVVDHFLDGQINLIVDVLVLGGLLALRSGRDVRAGGLLGAAAAIKLVPALFLALHVARGQWRVVAGAAMSVAVLFSLPAIGQGPEAAVAQTGEWVGVLGRKAVDPWLDMHSYNQSLVAMLMMRLRPGQGEGGSEVDRTRPSWKLASVAILAGLIQISCLAVVIWRLRRPGEPALEYALLFCCWPIFWRLAWLNAFVFLVFVYTVLLDHGRRRPWVLGVIALSALLNHSPGTVARWLPAGPDRWVAESGVLLGTLILWAVLVVLLGERGAAPDHEGEDSTQRREGAKARRKA